MKDKRNNKINISVLITQNMYKSINNTCEDATYPLFVRAYFEGGGGIYFQYGKLSLVSNFYW